MIFPSLLFCCLFTFPTRFIIIRFGYQALHLQGKRARCYGHFLIDFQGKTFQNAHVAFYEDAFFIQKDHVAIVHLRAAHAALSPTCDINCVTSEICLFPWKEGIIDAKWGKYDYFLSNG